MPQIAASDFLDAVESICSNRGVSPDERVLLERYARAEDEDHLGKEWRERVEELTGENNVWSSRRAARSLLRAFPADGKAKKDERCTVTCRLRASEVARLRQAAERHASTPSALVAKIIRERLDGVDSCDLIDVRVPRGTELHV